LKPDKRQERGGPSIFKPIESENRLPRHSHASPIQELQEVQRIHGAGDGSNPNAQTPPQERSDNRKIPNHSEASPVTVGDVLGDEDFANANL